MSSVWLFDLGHYLDLHCTEKPDVNRWIFFRPDWKRYMWAQTSLCWLHYHTTFYCSSMRLHESQWNETTANVVEPNNACLQSIDLLLNVRIGLMHETNVLVFSISLRHNMNFTEFNQCHMKHLTGCGSNHTYCHASQRQLTHALPQHWGQAFTHFIQTLMYTDVSTDLKELFTSYLFIQSTF